MQPRDRLLIHRKSGCCRAATVYIQGEVGKPGRYPLSTNMRVADLIRVGGGLKPSADAQAADLTKYQYSGQSKLTGEHEVVGLEAALAGDSNSNAPLRNGDVLTIRQLPGWNDLGASIALKGEVSHPGTYGIRPGSASVQFWSGQVAYNQLPMRTVPYYRGCRCVRWNRGLRTRSSCGSRMHKAVLSSYPTRIQKKSKRN